MLLCTLINLCLNVSENSFLCFLCLIALHSIFRLINLSELFLYMTQGTGWDYLGGRIFLVAIVSLVFCMWIFNCSNNICWKDYPWSMKWHWDLYRKSVECMFESTGAFSILFHLPVCLNFHNYYIVLIIVALW